MKILFDHNVPHKLRRSLIGHEVSTAEAMGWAELENGDLLRAGEDAGFDLMMTCDKNIPYQQNLRGRRLAMVVLSMNNWNILKHRTEPIIAAVDAATEGSFQYVKL